MARVEVEFMEIPSLSQLIESAAQSSSALDNNMDIKSAYLVSMKNIKLLIPPKQNILEVQVTNKHSLENMQLIDFEVFEQKEIVANGTLTIALDLQETT